MAGLMLKDFYSSIKNLKMYGVMLVFFAVIGFYGKSPTYVSFMTIVVAVSITLSSMSTDEYYHWDTYARALPFSRKEIVKAKYQVVFIAFLAMEVVGIFITAVTAYVLHLPVMENLIGTFAAGLVVPALCGILIPVFYKFGSEKGRIIYLGICLIPTLLILFLSKALGKAKMPEFVKKLLEMPHPEWVLLAAGIALVAFIFAISYNIAVKVYEKKEF